MSLSVRRSRDVSLLAIAVCFTVTSGTSYAQVTEQALPAAAGLDDIVVTAQKREENIQDVPIAITALSGSFLEARNIQSLDQLGSIAPNVSIERSPFNKSISQISMRGSVTVNPSILFEPAAGLYVDGIYIAKAQGSIFDVSDIQRIEVLRGPQGTLYGRNTLAGAINFVTRKPSGEFHVTAEATYGNYDYRRLKATIDLPRAGIFSAKLAGQIEKRAGFIRLVPNPFPQAGSPPITQDKRTNNIDRHGLIAQVRAIPSDTLTIDYKFDYSRMNERPDLGQLYSINRNGAPEDLFDPASPTYPFVGANLPINLYVDRDRRATASLSDVPEFEKVRTQGHGLTIAYDLGSTELRSITAFRKLSFDDAHDLDGTPFDVARAARFTDYKSFSQEAQLVGNALSDRLAYVAGIFYFKDKGYTVGPQSFFGGATAFQSDYGQKTTAFAVYGQLDFNITDAFVVTGGLRYNHERKTVRRLLITSPGTPQQARLIDVAFGDVPAAVYKNVSPAVSVRYDFTDELSIYARFAKGFKSGGFNGETNELGAPTAQFPVGAPIELLQPYRPEKVDSFEIGTKSRLFENTLQLNLAAFWDEHKDIQLSVFRGTGSVSSSVLNAAAARIRGIEGEFIWRPSRKLMVSGSLGYLDPEYKRFVEGGLDVSDNRAFPIAPKYTANLSVDWTVVEMDWGKFSLLGDMNYSSSYFQGPYPFVGATPSSQVASNTRSPGMTFVNLRATLAEISLGTAKASLSLWGRNLLKEDAPSNFSDFGPSFGGLTLATFPDPRTYGLTFAVKY